MKVTFNGGEFYRVTTHFNAVDSLHKNGHTGIDMAMESGTKLLSPADGVVERIVDYGSQNIGKGVIVKTENGDHLIFGHLSDNSQVHVGQTVHSGDLIGLSGDSGRSTGPHLHFGVKDTQNNFTDPTPYLNGNSNNVAQMPSPDNCSVFEKADAGSILSDSMSKFGDMLSDMTANFIDVMQFTLSLAIPKALLVLNLILSSLG
ncbi:metallo-endopeptidase [Bacillus phage vB_BmeM-Goe8]|uniref:Putative peptidase n=1 Tax=Bacillus phage vB_BmeM-Goe8 TaxID=2593638 RepID=A0A516KMZ2_9CAUD|nr:metallo-endopeptidase [Bacillus phage vB_BmeM-Goe8]QDP42962.1 putative peptidase [Bacillus phage vB_BmeM-Goe8]